MEHPPQAIVSSLNVFGLEPEENINSDQLMIIDGFTDAFGWGEFVSKWKYVCHDLASIAEVHDVVKQATAEIKPYNNLRGVVDSLTTLILASDSERSILNYIHHQMAIQKNYGTTTLYTIHAGAPPPRINKSAGAHRGRVIWISKVEVDDEPRDVIQIKKLRESSYSSRKYFFNADEEGATLEVMKKCP